MALFSRRVTFLVALERALGAAVGFYGGGIVAARFPQFPALVDRVEELKTPWLGLFGDQDQGIPVADVEQLRTALERAPVDTHVVRYEDADHGFHCDARPAYNKSTARKLRKVGMDILVCTPEKLLECMARIIRG